MSPRRAVFLDRDGTINVEKDYLIDPAEFEFIPGVPQALRRLKEAGFLLVVVTNQSGVARGYFDLQDVAELNRHMTALLAEQGVTVDRIEVCPHHPTRGQGRFRMDCECRKGRPGMLLRAAQELDVDLHGSYMIGDKQADIEAGLNAGCRPIMVKTGYGHSWPEVVDMYSVDVVADLPQAVALILNDGCR